MTYDIPKVFICIGSREIIGDSLGPLVGTYLKQEFNNLDVYGDFYNTVDFHNIGHVIKDINRKYNKRCIKFLIDSALGDNIGNIVITSGDLYIGKGLNKNKRISGDINIKGIVGKNYNDVSKNFIELKNKEFAIINLMAIDIVNSIKKSFAL